MSVEVVPSAVGIEAWLREGIARNLDCLFTVAYLSDVGVERIETVLRQRAEKRRFSLRVLFQDDDLFTEPNALDRLLKARQRRGGAIVLRRAFDPNFHGKAYGFRRSRSGPPASVLIGSANLTNKAIGTLSGEIDVHVSTPRLTSELWAAMEDFWNAGVDVDPQWLRDYRAAYEKKRLAMKDADRVQRGWSRRRRPPKARRAPSIDQRLWIEHVAPVTDEQNKAARRGRRVAVRDGIEIPDDFVIYEDRSAYAVPAGEDVLEIFWRSDEARDGVAAIRVIRTGRPARVKDPKSGKTFWLLPRQPVRGAGVVLRKKDDALVERVLAQSGKTLEWLDAKAGRARVKRWGIVLQAVDAVRSAQREGATKTITATAVARPGRAGSRARARARA